MWTEFIAVREEDRLSQQTHQCGFDSGLIALKPQSSKATSKRKADELCMEDKNNKESRMAKSSGGNWLDAGDTKKTYKFFQVVALL